MSLEEKQHTSVEEEKADSVDERAPVVPAHTPDEERRLVRKLDMRIMPIACIMYLFACECLFQLARAHRTTLTSCRFGQDEPGQRAFAGPAPRRPARRPHRYPLQLGQLRLLLLIRACRL